jgi:hypothetical protein
VEVDRDLGHLNLQLAPWAMVGASASLLRGGGRMMEKAVVGRKLVVVPALIVAMALLSVGCSSSSDSGKGIGSQGGTVKLSDAISVVVPAGSATDGTRLRLKGETDGPDGVGDVAADHQFAQVEVTKGQIVALVTVEFANVAPPSEGTVAQMGLHQMADGTWESTTASYDEARQVMSVSTPGFSKVGFVRMIGNIGSSVNDLAVGIYHDMTAGLFDKAVQPTCANEDAARANGWQVVSSNSSNVNWCFGIEGGQRVVKAVNANRYPRSFTITGAGSVQQPPGDLSSWAAEQMSLLPAGVSYYAVNSAEEISINPGDTPGTPTVVTTEYDGVAAAMFQLQFGTDLAEAIKGKLGLSTAKSALSGATKLTVECSSTLTIMATNPTAPTGPLWENCVGPLVSEGAKGSLAAFLTTIIGIGVEATQWALSGVDYVTDLGRDAYNIVVSPPVASCTTESVAAALSAASQKQITVSDVKCAGDWAAATVSAPLVDTQDGPKFLVKDNSRWVPKGSSMGSCPANFGMPDDVFTQLIGDLVANGCAPSPTTAPSPSSLGGCANPQAVANGLRADFSAHWPGAEFWYSQPDFESYARPKIEAMARSCGKSGTATVISDMNIVGITYQAFSSWAGV